MAGGAAWLNGGLMVDIALVIRVLQYGITTGL